VERRTSVKKMVINMLYYSISVTDMIGSDLASAIPGNQT